MGIFGEEWVGYLTATGSAAQETSPAKRGTYPPPFLDLAGNTPIAILRCAGNNARCIICALKV